MSRLLLLLLLLLLLSPRVVSESHSINCCWRRPHWWVSHCSCSIHLALALWRAPRCCTLGGPLRVYVQHLNAAGVGDTSGAPLSVVIGNTHT